MVLTSEPVVTPIGNPWKLYLLPGTAAFWTVSRPAAWAAVVAVSVPIRPCALASAMALDAVLSSPLAEYNMPKSSANPKRPSISGTRITASQIVTEPRWVVRRRGEPAESRLQPGLAAPHLLLRQHISLWSCELRFRAVLACGLGPVLALSLFGRVDGQQVRHNRRGQ